jgi:hypothetical protein
MNQIRIAAIALALCACSALAQQPAKGTLTVVVTDEIGAWISGARITATETQTGARFDAIADGKGQAVLHLAQGSYKLNVQAKGFISWEESKVEVTLETQRTVALVVANCGCSIIVEGPVGPPVEYLPMTAEIPLIPMQQFIPSAKPLRHRARWF